MFFIPQIPQHNFQVPTVTGGQADIDIKVDSLDALMAPAVTPDDSDPVIIGTHTNCGNPDCPLTIQSAGASDNLLRSKCGGVREPIPVRAVSLYDVLRYLGQVYG